MGKPDSTKVEKVDTQDPRQVLEEVLKGNNGTVFNMEDAQIEGQGIIPFVVKEVFAHIEMSLGWEFILNVSCFGLSRNIMDLLKADAKLSICEDKKKNIKNLPEEKGIGSEKEAMKYFNAAMKNMKEHHHSFKNTVFALKIGQENVGSGEKRSGTLYVVARSEKARKSGAKGQTLDSKLVKMLQVENADIDDDEDDDTENDEDLEAAISKPKGGSKLSAYTIILVTLAFMFGTALGIWFCQM